LKLVVVGFEAGKDLCFLELLLGHAGCGLSSPDVAGIARQQRAGDNKHSGH
jgi:hypothetical protein